MRPVSWETLGKDTQLLRFFVLTAEVLLVKWQGSALHSSEFRESKLTEDFLRVVKFLELDEGVVEVFEQWSENIK